ncbi:hypothetical protein JDV02_001960 [Purpureocillium takamizusanense]|uniref:Peptide hydrolase n=1 Tax=Purpureocillium takamizusanense TaxID=2060973 RepID=A0A9Q8V6Z5_9HYPO|nr:uncharacterized protein JDV02_001960 [Purpureocillium takamizusanense]UNI15425.1 hypothetical protein JDV02_001960 [Purpureocillium takamizusanense]
MKVLRSLLYAALLAGGVLGKELTEPGQIEQEIELKELQRILWNFNKIARDNGGNRAYGLPGYNASMDFVLERVQKRFGKHMNTYVQGFTHLFETTRNITLKGPDGKEAVVVGLMYNTATPLPGGVSAPLVNTPVDDTRGSACFEDQWKGLDVAGKIALIKRGVCPVADKLKLAKAGGALAAVLYNQASGEIPGATLSAENIGKLVPVGVTTLENGEAWSKRVAAGERLTVTLVVDAVTETRPSWNIISETKEGDPSNVVMLGAHLDGVQAGPGINDDGSGSAALLVIMEEFTKYKGFKNKIRFAWWGAEESGLVGSLYYASQLPEEEADRIKFYFNYDMIASNIPQYAVYADNDAHMYGATPLYDYLKADERPAAYSKFGSSSDYVGFLKLGIPSSGIFTGAGMPWDHCYHKACDDLQNINWDTLMVNTKAAAHVAAKFAISLQGVPSRNKTSANPKSRREVRRSFDEWSTTARIIEKTHNCGTGSSVV